MMGQSHHGDVGRGFYDCQQEIVFLLFSQITTFTAQACVQQTARGRRGEMEDERHNIEVALVDKELMHIVFGFLRFADLASISAVCRFTPPNHKKRTKLVTSR